MNQKYKFINKNLCFLTDFYELTMANGYLENGFDKITAVFDVFFRQVPDNGGFAIFAGLEQVVHFIQNLKFNEDEICFLRSLNLFSEKFLTFLKNFKFNCSVWSVEEGIPIFPNEPVLTVQGPLIQAQMLETMLLNILNHQCLIATKANRIVRAAKGKNVFEFGARRAHGADSAIFGSRAAYIGGCCATSCVEAGFEFSIPLFGTMSHSWVQSFENELDAFETFVKIYPKNCVLLIDTYNILKSGIINAIKIFKKIKSNNNKDVKKAIRIDSGDIAYFSKKVRKILNENDCSDVSIIASNALDEFLIEDLILQDSCIDEFAVGENLITAKSSPVFGGVYKLSAIGKGNEIKPKIKISESVEKINLPGLKKVYRFFDNTTKKCVADLITLSNENLNLTNNFEIFDPQVTWKKKKLKNVLIKELLIPIFQEGKLIYNLPNLEEIRNKCLNTIENNLWNEVKRFNNPHKYYVDWSKKLLNLRNQLIEIEKSKY